MPASKTSNSRLVQMLLVIVAYLVFVRPRHGHRTAWMAFRPGGMPPLVDIRHGSGYSRNPHLVLGALFFLGRNWSATVTVKQDHELVRSGPLRPRASSHFIPVFYWRCFGTAINLGEVRGFTSRCFWPFWLGNGKSLLERKTFMQQQFGDSYYIYRRQVKALIPFVW